MDILQLKNITKRFSATVALQNVSVALQEGTIHGVCGENGAGKSTLVKLVARFHDPDSGRVLFDGTDARDVPPEHLHRRIASVFQRVNRYEATAAQNIQYGDWQRLLDIRSSSPGALAFGKGRLLPAIGGRTFCLF